MKVAIATQQNMVSAHFGHCPEFTLVDIEDGSETGRMVIPAPPHQPGFLPGFLAEKGVNVVIAGGMGPRAIELFNAQGVDVIPGIQGGVEEVLKAFISGALTAGGNLCASEHGHHDCGGHGDHECDH